MLLKTYRGPDLAKALAKASAELGSDALVLGTTEKKSRLGLSVVEVTVGVARDPEPGRTRPDESLPRLAREVRELRGLVEKDRPAARSNDPDPRSEFAQGSPHVAMQTAVDVLVASGLSRDLAVRFARATSHPGTGTDANRLASVAVGGMQRLLPFAPLTMKERCTFVVGPPGSGKTTTVAKLAARAAVLDDGPVFFAEADIEGIGSFEQAEIFSRHIGATAARIDRADDLLRALDDAGDNGHVFVDTTGLGAGDTDGLDELNRLRRRVPEAATALLIPSGLHHRDASDVIKRFEALEPTCVGLARVDDGGRPGELVTALARSDLPLAFLTNGRRVPDDLQNASPHALAALLLRAGRTSDGKQEISV